MFRLQCSEDLPVSIENKIHGLRKDLEFFRIFAARLWQQHLKV